MNLVHTTMFCLDRSGEDTSIFNTWDSNSKPDWYNQLKKLAFFYSDLLFLLTIIFKNEPCYQE